MKIKTTKKFLKLSVIIIIFSFIINSIYIGAFGIAIGAYCLSNTNI